MFTKRDLLRSAALAAITASTAKSIPVHAQTSADSVIAPPPGPSYSLVGTVADNTGGGGNVLCGLPTPEA
jgi:hypothetical protein